MAQNEQSNHAAESGTTTLARVSGRRKGYDVQQVDAFLEQAHALYDGDGTQLKRSDIQDASFDIVRGGYSIAQVDATLERLGQAVTDKQTTYEINELGRVAWKAQVEAQYHELQKHADRAEGERFARGAARTPSYDRKQVDHLIDDVMRSAKQELHVISNDGQASSLEDELPVMTSKSVEDMIFTQRTGASGYDERQVDYYLNACVDLLGSLESYERIAQYVKPSGAHAAHDTHTEPAPLIGADAVAPTTQLASSGTAPVVTAATTAPATTALAASQASAEAPAIPFAQDSQTAPTTAQDNQDQSFDEVSRQEQEIFAQVQENASTPVSAAVTQAIPPIQVDSTSVHASTNPTTSAISDATSVPQSFAPKTAQQTKAASQTSLPAHSEDSLPLAPLSTTAQETAAPSSTSEPDIKHAPTLSDIAPITPAPRTIPEYERMAEKEKESISAVPSMNAISDETTIAVPDQPSSLSSPSLAALASLAQTTREQAEDTAEANSHNTAPQLYAVPRISDISLPNIPSLGTHTASVSTPPSTQRSAVVPDAAQPTTSSPTVQHESSAQTSSAQRPVIIPADDHSHDPHPEESPLEFAKNHGIDVEIPDLSFPTISTDEPLVIDDKPNEKLS